MPAASVPMIVMAVGSAVSAGAAVYSGQQQKKAADYNAKVATLQSKAIESQTNESIRRARIQRNQILGAQRASSLSSGATMSGSSLTSLMANAATLETNIADIATQGGAQQAAALNQASLYRMQGSAAQTAGYISGAGSLMSGLGSAGMAGYQTGLFKAK